MFRTLTALALLIVALQPSESRANFYELLGVAMEGYDPVAYFIDGHATVGEDGIQLEWDGTVWHFASTENRELFRESPLRYAPQYGGYCAYAASKGSLANGDPEAWTIRDGKLYLNYSRAVRDTWRKEAARYIRQADAQWPKLRRR